MIIWLLELVVARGRALHSSASPIIALILVSLLVFKSILTRHMLKFYDMKPIIARAMWQANVFFRSAALQVMDQSRHGSHR